MREVCLNNCVHNTPMKVRLNSIKLNLRYRLPDHTVRSVTPNQKACSDGLFHSSDVVDDIDTNWVARVALGIKGVGGSSARTFYKYIMSNQVP